MEFISNKNEQRPTSLDNVEKTETRRNTTMARAYLAGLLAFTRFAIQTHHYKLQWEQPLLVKNLHKNRV
jgi:hypothetical protein